MKFSNLLLKKLKKCPNCQSIRYLLLVARFKDDTIFSHIPLDVFKLLYFLSTDHMLELTREKTVNEYIEEKVEKDLIETIKKLSEDIDKEIKKLKEDPTVHFVPNNIQISRYDYANFVKSQLPQNYPTKFHSIEFKKVPAIKREVLAIVPCSVNVKWLRYRFSEIIAINPKHAYVSIDTEEYEEVETYDLSMRSEAMRNDFSRNEDEIDKEYINKRTFKTVLKTKKLKDTELLCNYSELNPSRNLSDYIDKLHIKTV